MGTIINLRIGKLEVAWSKNEFLQNHSELFRQEDLGHEKIYLEKGHKKGRVYCRRLKDMIGRLSLLGYSPYNSKRTFLNLKKDVERYCGNLGISYEVISEVLSLVDVNKVRVDDFNDYGVGEYVRDYISEDPEFKKKYHLKDNFSREDFEFLQSFDAKWILTELSRNPKNLNEKVIWAYGDIVESGYFKESEIFEPLPRNAKFLLVTEGSSDTSILRKALEIIRSDVSDFFEFVDMSEGYPFSGTGNQVNFLKGLAAIGVMNNVLAIFDNDAEGISSFKKVKKLKLPTNIRASTLPNLEEFKKIKTKGPSGIRRGNINGKAAAIESYLDLKYGVAENPTWLWKSYQTEIDRYHGVLEGKEKYAKKFYQIKPNDKGYDFKKLRVVVETIIQECTKMVQRPKRKE